MPPLPSASQTHSHPGQARSACREGLRLRGQHENGRAAGTLAPITTNQARKGREGGGQVLALPRGHQPWQEGGGRLEGGCATQLRKELGDGPPQPSDSTDPDNAVTYTQYTATFSPADGPKQSPIDTESPEHGSILSPSSLSVPLKTPHLDKCDACAGALCQKGCTVHPTPVCKTRV